MLSIILSIILTIMSVAAADIILKISRSMIKQNNTFGGLLSENPLVFYDDSLCSSDGGDDSAHAEHVSSFL